LSLSSSCNRTASLLTWSRAYQNLIYVSECRLWEKLMRLQIIPEKSSSKFQIQMSRWSKNNIPYSLFFKSSITPRLQPQCGIYLLFNFLSFIVCRFGECFPSENARIEAASSLGGCIFYFFMVPIKAIKKH